MKYFWTVSKYFKFWFQVAEKDGDCAQTQKDIELKLSNRPAKIEVTYDKASATDKQLEIWPPRNEFCSGTEKGMDDEAMCAGNAQNLHCVEWLLVHLIAVTLDNIKTKMGLRRQMN